MPNLYDYLDWRGDLALDRVPFNDVDAMILARVSYLPFDGIVPSGFKEQISLAEANAVLSEALPGELVLGGHSKGGNLAVYAAAFCRPRLQQRVLKVYNYDGPGFHAEIMAECGQGQSASRAAGVHGPQERCERASGGKRRLM